MPSSQETLEQLRRHLTPLHDAPREHVPCGIEALSSLLPHSGFVRGSLMEWEAPGPGCHLLPLVLATLRQAISPHRPLLVIDCQQHFFAPSASRMGISLQELLLVRPATFQDALWATEQALRCHGVGVVLCLGLDVPPRQTGILFRRFQRAAETGQTLGVFLHFGASPAQAAWSDIRFRAQPVGTPNLTGQPLFDVQIAGGRWQGLRTVSARSGVRLVLDETTGQFTDETFRLPLASPLASATLPASPASA